MIVTGVPQDIDMIPEAFVAVRDPVQGDEGGTQVCPVIAAVAIAKVQAPVVTEGATPFAGLMIMEWLRVPPESPTATGSEEVHTLAVVIPQSIGDVALIVVALPKSPMNPAVPLVMPVPGGDPPSANPYPEESTIHRSPGVAPPGEVGR